MGCVLIQWLRNAHFWLLFIASLYLPSSGVAGETYLGRRGAETSYFQALSQLQDNQYARRDQAPFETLFDDFKVSPDLDVSGNILDLKAPYFLGRGAQDVYLRNLANYKAKSGNGFFYKDYLAEKVDIHLRWTLESDAQIAKTKITCEGPFELQTLLKFRQSQKTENGRYRSQGHLYPDKDLANYVIRVTERTGFCDLEVNWQGTKYKARAIPESRGIEAVKNLSRHQVEICERSSILDEGAFYRSCEQSLKEIEMLVEPLESLSKKVEMLLGRPMSNTEILNYRPGDPIDFSQAPDLTGVYISTLFFEYDLTGFLILELLRWHARGGTPVWILNSKPGLKAKSRKALEAFADKFPLVQIQFLKIKDFPGDDGFKNDVASLHSVDHIKMFAVLGSEDRGQVILGGRNIGDRYHFQKTPSLGRDFIVYGQDKSEIFYEDFDIKISDRRLTESLARQFLKFWGHRNGPFQVAPSTLPLAGPKFEHLEGVTGSRDDIRVQHQVSYPKFDNRALERFFVRKIDAAKKQISIVTPYYQPTVILLDALRKAVKRGVRVRVVTNAHYFGEGLADAFIKSANLYAVNKTYREFEIWSYRVPNKLLHSKIFVFDNDFAILGSPNLNQRSFNYDTENILSIWSSSTAGKLMDLIDVYIKDSQRVESKLDTKPLPTAVFKALQTEF